MHDDRLDPLRYGIARPSPTEFYISTDSFISRNPYKELLNSIYGRRKEEEMSLMNLNDLKVVVGNKAFRPYSVEYNSLDYKLNIEAIMPPGVIRPYGVPSDEIREYCKADVAATKELYDRMNEYNRFRIEKVIFNDPATIVLWADGTKTVVKAEGEAFDPEKGLAMAMCKKMLGNNGKYYKEFKKWLPKEAVEKTKEPIAKVTNVEVSEDGLKVDAVGVKEADK